MSELLLSIEKKMFYILYKIQLVKGYYFNKNKFIFKRIKTLCNEKKKKVMMNSTEVFLNVFHWANDNRELVLGLYDWSSNITAILIMAVVPIILVVIPFCRTKFTEKFIDTVLVIVAGLVLIDGMLLNMRGLLLEEYLVEQEVIINMWPSTAYLSKMHASSTVIVWKIVTDFAETYMGRHFVMLDELLMTYIIRPLMGPVILMLGLA